MSSFTAIDVLRVKKLGALVRARGTRLTAQVALLLLALVLVVQGFAGPELAPKNLATSLVWIHFRGVLVLVLLAAGNLFCMGCPLVLARDVARRLHAPRWNWPRVLRNKWLACGLFVAILFGYELFDWWSSPRATAILILSYFGAVVVVDTLFKHAAFCKFVCPIGQFNFVASTASPLEVRARSLAVCADCTTKDCIRGRRAENSDEIVQRGCELALYVPLKTGNLDCTFCLDCVHACPHDNVALATRLPASELFDDPRRSGIGKLSLRGDFAALVVLFTFGALLNAFGMVSPVYAVQSWIASTLGLRSEWPVLSILFGIALVVEPVVLLGLAAWLTRRALGSREPLLAVVARYAFVLAPLGFGIWLAHYAFHFLTGLLTFVPIAQKALLDAGVSIAGEPRWSLTGLPAHVVYPIEIGFLVLGVIGTWIVAWRLAQRDAPLARLGVFVPWAVLGAALFAAALWLLGQPMEMRGTFLS